MAFSVNSPVGDGVTTQFAVSFTNGLYSRDNVHVFVGDEETERAFTWINDGLIDVQGTVPAAGETVTIRRIMDKTNKAVDFADGEILDERNLDTMVDQLYNIAHEFLDGYGLSEINTDVDMRGNSLTNIGGGDPNDRGSLATIGDLQDAIVSPEDLVDAVRISNNFSDLDDTAVCRTNLDVYSTDEVHEVAPGANLLINGDFQVWQRGTSFPGAPAGYSADRWYSPGNRTANQSNDVPSNTEFTLSAEFKVGTATNTTFSQPIELPATGEAGVFQQGATFTLSGWIKTAELGRQVDYSVRFADDAALTNEVIVEPSTLLSTGDATWQYITRTFTVGVNPAGTNKCLVVQLNSAADSVQTTVTVTGLKLERGSVATPFESEPYGDVLAKCQRYYVSLNASGSALRSFGMGYGLGTTTARPLCMLPTTMRATPSFSFNGAAGDYRLFGEAGSVTPTAITVNSVSDGEVFINVTTASGISAGQCYVFRGNTTGADLQLDAEL